MAVFTLPTRQDLSNYEVEVDLDQVTYRLRFKFNSRDEAWYMSVLDANGVILRAGIKLVSDWEILRLWRDTNVRPAGEIITLNLGEDLTKPGLEQLGTDTLLLYDGLS